MQRWEYLDVWYRGGSWVVNEQTVRIASPYMDFAHLNEWGSQGWELVSILGTPDGDGYRWVFKRPRP